MLDGRLQPDTVHFNAFSTTDYRVHEFMLNLNKQNLGNVQSTFRFELGRNRSITIAADQFPQAWEALSACMDSLYEDLGVDQTLAAQVATKPEGFSLQFLDAPRPKSHSGFELVALFWVAEDGRVDECRLLKPTGDDGFDARFCNDLKRKGKFKPARDASGKPMRAPVFERGQIRTTVTTTRVN